MLREEYTIDTPENVTFGYQVAHIGSRFVGALIDTTLIVLLLVALNLLLVWVLSAAGEAPSAFRAANDQSWIVGVVIAVYLLFNFAIIWGYYLLFELRWNGRTPGKRVAGTQVLRTNGGPAGFSEVAIRNLVRIIDFMPFGYAIGVVTMFLNAKARRLGDFAAGTVVVRVHKDIKVEQLSTWRPSRPLLAGPDATVDDWLVRFPDLRQLSGEDYQLILDVLNRQRSGGVSSYVINHLATVMAGKVGAMLPATPAERLGLLSALAEAYQSLAAKP